MFSSPQEILKTLPLSDENLFLLTEIFEVIPLQIAVKSLCQENYGVILIWNREAELGLGITSEEALGRTDRDLFPEDQVAQFGETDHEVERTGEALVIPREEITTSDGRLRVRRTLKTPIFDSEEELLAMLVVSEDITDRNGSHHTHTEDFQFPGTLNGHFPGAVFQMRTDPQGRVSFPYMSPGIEALTGHCAREIMEGKVNPMDQIVPEDLPGYRAHMARSQREHSHCRQEFSLRTPKGKFLRILLNALPKAQPEGSTIWSGFLTEATDTPSSSQETAIRPVTPLPAPSIDGTPGGGAVTVLSKVNHDIRNMVSGVIGFSEILASTPLDPEQADYVSTIHRNSNELLALLSDVLDYSKIEAGHLNVRPVPADVVATTQGILEAFHDFASVKNLSLTFVTLGDIPDQLLCDTGLLQRVLQRLMDNAVQFTDQGGVDIELEADEMPDRSRWLVTIRVHDTGRGIAREALGSIFDPFSRPDGIAHREGGGVGLGLALVKALCKQAGWEVKVKSRPNVGTTFLLEMPLEQVDPTTVPANEIHTRISSPVGKPKILLVDDNPTNRRLIQIFIKQLGHDVDEATDGREAVEMATARRYDLIFMDLEMPGMDGFEATRLIRASENGSTPRIVALIAHALAEHREQSADAGMDTYLNKPVRQSDLKDIFNGISPSPEPTGP